MDPSYEYLGLQLRGMVDRIYRHYMTPEMQDIAAGFDLVRQRAQQELTVLVDEICSFDAPQKKPKSRLFGIFETATKIHVDINPKPPELQALDQLRQRVRNEDDFPAACMTALISVVSGILGKQGRIVTDRQLIVDLALRVFCNDHGSAEIGHLIAPIFENAAKAEGLSVFYRRKANQL